MMSQVKAYTFRITKQTKLVISFNSYRTTKRYRVEEDNNRVIFPTYLLLLPTKEIAFGLDRKKLARQQPAFGFLQKSLITPFVMIMVGFAGLVNYSQDLNSQNKGLEPTATFSVPTPRTATKKTETIGLEKSEPIRIKIPSAKVNAPIKPVGQNPDKTMEVPPLFENITGWYKLGPTPGEVGPAVIVGHVDTYEGPSVFFYLKEMKPGEIIEITRKNGKKIQFKVTALKQFSQDKFPTEEVYGNIDNAGLRVITCGGTFNEKTQRYSANTVVFAELVTKKA
jgi:sortase (surface protein transpeptidase)